MPEEAAAGANMLPVGATTHSHGPADILRRGARGTRVVVPNDSDVPRERRQRRKVRYRVVPQID